MGARDLTGSVLLLCSQKTPLAQSCRRRRAGTSYSPLHRYRVISGPHNVRHGESVANSSVVPTKPLEDGDRSDGEPAMQRQVGSGSS